MRQRFDSVDERPGCTDLAQEYLCEVFHPDPEGTVMMWSSAISDDRKTDLVHVPGNLTAVRYREEILQLHLMHVISNVLHCFLVLFAIPVATFGGVDRGSELEAVAGAHVYSADPIGVQWEVLSAHGGHTRYYL
jgi:hypothetical protein